MVRTIELKSGCYDERRDAGYYHTCLKALQSGMLTSSNAVPAFTKNGFCNWKNAMEKKKGFQKHESSDSHMEAVARYVTAPSTVMDDIGDLLSERHALEKSNPVQHPVQHPVLSPKKKRPKVRQKKSKSHERVTWCACILPYETDCAWRSINSSYQ